MPQYRCRHCGKPIAIDTRKTDVAMTEGIQGDEPNKMRPKIVVKTCPHCGTKNQFTLR